MNLKKVEIIKYKNFENVVIDFEKNDFPNVYSIASENGGGKSTLLQFIFIMLHCSMDDKRKVYIERLLNILELVRIGDFIKFIVEQDKKNYYIKFSFDKFSDSIEPLYHKVFSINNIIYAIYLNTNMSDKQLTELSNSVYLAVPDAQPLHFLSEQDNKEEMKKLLPNFSTYEFPTEQSILDSFENQKQEDFKNMRVYGEYGTNYIDFQDELKDFIEGKEIGENRDGTKVTFKLKGSDEELLSKDLSHGELRKLGIYIWLKSIVKKDSIILMDEVDIALHPKWQYELVENLIQWSKGSQFLLATHSPQILSSTYYKNLILLEKKDNKTIIKQLNKPVRDNDINNIITVNMNATHIPSKLAKLQFEYRELIEDNKKDTNEAKELEKQILKWESPDSAFFQRIKMYLRFHK